MGHPSCIIVFMTRLKKVRKHMGDSKTGWMTSIPAAEKPRLKIATKNFFIPVSEEHFYRNLDSIIAKSQPEVTYLAKSFKNNLQAVNQTLSLPFKMAVRSVHSQRFQQFHIAEMIRSAAGKSKQSKLRVLEEKKGSYTRMHKKRCKRSISPNPE